MARLALAPLVVLAGYAAGATWCVDPSAPLRVPYRADDGPPSLDRCGKNYEQGSPVVPPGGQFPTPATSDTPLLAFRCAPAIKPYLASEAGRPAAILFDTFVTYAEIADTAPITLPSGGRLGDVQVSVKVDGRPVAAGTVPLNASKVELPLSLTGLVPRKDTYDVSCSAAYGEQTFEATGSLSFLPDPTDGRSVVKLDGRTGAVLAKPVNDQDGEYQTVFPVGFYTGFSDYLATNLSTVNDAKAKG